MTLTPLIPLPYYFSPTLFFLLSNHLISACLSLLEILIYALTMSSCHKVPVLLLHVCCAQLRLCCLLVASHVRSVESCPFICTILQVPRWTLQDCPLYIRIGFSLFPQPAGRCYTPECSRSVAKYNDNSLYIF